MTVPNLIQIGESGVYVIAEFDGSDESNAGFVARARCPVLRERYIANNNQKQIWR